MENGGLAGIVTGIAGAASAIGVAWVNRGSGAALKELQDRLEKVVGTIGLDGKPGKDSLLGQLAARVAAIESSLPSIAALGGLSGEVATLRGHVDAQLKAAKQEWTSFLRAQRQQGSQSPNCVDDEARHDAAEALRLVREIVSERKEDRESSLALQLRLQELWTKLDMLLRGDIQFGGRK